MPFKYKIKFIGLNNKDSTLLCVNETMQSPLTRDKEAHNVTLFCYTLMLNVQHQY